jgi:hypothetical protein
MKGKDQLLYSSSGHFTFETIFFKVDVGKCVCYKWIIQYFSERGFKKGLVREWGRISKFPTRCNFVSFFSQIDNFLIKHESVKPEILQAKFKLSSSYYYLVMMLDTTLNFSRSVSPTLMMNIHIENTIFIQSSREGFGVMKKLSSSWWLFWWWGRKLC